MSDQPVSSGRVAPPTLDEIRAEAMEWGKKPRRFGSFYVAEHMIRAMRAYGWTIVVGAVGQPIIYLLGMAVGLAAIIDQTIDHGGMEVSYLQFVAPALLMTAAISVASEEFSYPIMSGFKWRRYFYGFGATGLSSGQIATGAMFGALARITLTVVLYYGFLLLFGAVVDPVFGALSILVAILVGASFGNPLMAYAASIEDDKGQFAMVQRFIFMPMFLFSGTFYPLSNLPEWLHWIGWVSPLWHASELGRTLSYGAGEAPLLTVIHVVYLIALAVVGYVVARRLFERRLSK